MIKHHFIYCDTIMNRMYEWDQYLPFRVCVNDIYRHKEYDIENNVTALWHNIESSEVKAFKPTNKDFKKIGDSHGEDVLMVVEDIKIRVKDEPYLECWLIDIDSTV